MRRVLPSLMPSLTTAMLLTAATTTTACSSRTVTFKDDEFRFPAGFSGVAVVVWGDPHGQPLERPRPDGRRFVFPADGVLRLKDAQPPGQRWVGAHPPQFVFVAADGSTTPIASIWHPAGRVEQIDMGSSFSRQKGDGPVCSGETFLVGFKDDAGKLEMRRRTGDRVEAACDAVAADHARGTPTAPTTTPSPAPTAPTTTPSPAPTPSPTPAH
jgi:hypothetical protein